MGQSRASIGWKKKLGLFLDEESLERIITTTHTRDPVRSTCRKTGLNCEPDGTVYMQSYNKNLPQHLQLMLELGKGSGNCLKFGGPTQY